MIALLELPEPLVFNLRTQIVLFQHPQGPTDRKAGQKNLLLPNLILPPPPTYHHDPIDRIRPKILPPFSPLVPLLSKLIIGQKPPHPQNPHLFRLLPKDPFPIGLLGPKPPKVLAHLHISPGRDDKMNLHLLP